MQPSVRRVGDVRPRPEHQAAHRSRHQCVAPGQPVGSRTPASSSSWPRWTSRLPSARDAQPDGNAYRNLRQAPSLVSCYAGDGNQDGLTFIHGWKLPRTARPRPSRRERRVGLERELRGLSPRPTFLRTGDCDLGLRGRHPLRVPGDPTGTQSGDGRRRLRRTGMRTPWLRHELRRPGSGGRRDDLDRLRREVRRRLLRTLDVLDRGRDRVSCAHRPPANVHRRCPPVRGRAGRLAAGIRHHPGRAPALSSTSSSRRLDARSSRRELARHERPPLASVVVTVGLRPPFQIQSPLEPPRRAPRRQPLREPEPGIRLRPSHSTSRRRSRTAARRPIARTTATGTTTETWSGPTSCVRTTRTACGLPPDTSTPSPPPDCVRVETGDKIGQFRHGIDLRLKTPSCATNNWPDALSDFPRLLHQPRLRRTIHATSR